MILQLDVGNSALKWRLRSDGQTLERGRLAAGEGLPSVSSAPTAVWVASVADAQSEQQLAQMIGDCWGIAPWFARSSGSACGVINSYQAPERMGVDRWLAMIAGFRIEAWPV